MKNIIRLGISVSFALIMTLSFSFAQSSTTTPSKNQKKAALKVQQSIQTQKVQPNNKRAAVHVAPTMKKHAKVVTRTVQPTIATPKKETPKKEE